ncbi:hypothetical protein EYR41_012023 [Orbilia oligospora]|uniref:Uncharacterized protein n=1 Tax=Orbilia oligospora TaxID=2813651 RepID=A0A8H2DLH1_ORBOL|nr:hypothetical protein EYR41_012023 [Orbilia oligospora]
MNSSRTASETPSVPATATTLNVDFEMLWLVRVVRCSAVHKSGQERDLSRTLCCPHRDMNLPTCSIIKVLTYPADFPPVCMYSVCVCLERHLIQSPLLPSCRWMAPSCHAKDPQGPHFGKSNGRSGFARSLYLMYLHTKYILTEVYLSTNDIASTNL